MTCHKEKSLGLYNQWYKSEHAKHNVTCLDCHQAAQGEAAERGQEFETAQAEAEAERASLDSRIEAAETGQRANARLPEAPTAGLPEKAAVVEADRQETPQMVQDRAPA